MSDSSNSLPDLTPLWTLGQDAYTWMRVALERGRPRHQVERLARRFKQNQCVKAKAVVADALVSLGAAVGMAERQGFQVRANEWAESVAGWFLSAAHKGWPDPQDDIFARRDSLQQEWQLLVSAMATPVAEVAGSNDTEEPPLVELLGMGEPCRVLGEDQPALTDAQYQVIEALLNAGEQGLTKDALEAHGRGGARRTLKGLQENNDAWAAIISFPGTAGHRYRLRRPS